MDKKTILIIFVVVIIAIVLYIVFKDNKSIDKTPINNNTVINPVYTPPISNTVDNSTINPGDSVYLNPMAPYVGGTNEVGAGTGATGIPIYSFPIADSAGTYLKGVTRTDWNPGNPIGSAISLTTDGNWVKISMNNVQTWQYTTAHGYQPTIIYLTGDYFMKVSDIRKTPY